MAFVHYCHQLAESAVVSVQLVQGSKHGSAASARRPAGASRPWRRQKTRAGTGAVDCASPTHAFSFPFLSLGAFPAAP